MKFPLVATSAAAVLGLAALTNAQTAEQINATQVSTRRAWCESQVAVCTNVCAQKTQQNLCNFNNLQFVCVCGNGTRLDFSSSDVDLTIPFFICTNYQWQPCVRACPPGDQPCQDKCNSQHQCGRVKANPNPTAPADAPKESDKPAAAPAAPAAIDTSGAEFTMAKGAVAVLAAALGSAAVALL